MPINYDDYRKKYKKQLTERREAERKARAVKVTNTNTSTPATTKKKEEKRTWFSGGALSDGYDFGDITKTILGTTADIGTNILKGTASAGEGLAKVIVGGTAEVSDWLGADDFSKKLKNRLAGKDEEFNKRKDKYFVSSNLNKVSDKLDSSSLTGEKLDDLSSSVGNLGASMAGQSIGIPWYVTMGGSSAGHELENAYSKGASTGEAWGSALITGASEVLFEKLSGGIKFGGKTLDEGAKRLLSDAITNKTAKTLSKFGLDMVGEGTEEVLTEVVQNVGKKLTYEDEKTWKEILASEEALDNYLESFIGGAVMGGGFNVGKLKNSLQTGQDYDSVGSNVKDIKETQQDIAPIQEQVQQPVNPQETVEDIDNQIAVLEKQLMATENDTEYERLSNQIQELENRANQLEQQDIAPIKENAQNIENTVQNNEIAPVQMASVEQTNQPTTQEVNSNLPVEVESNAQKTPITESIEELKAQLENAKGFFEKGAINEKIRALENGYTSVEDYRVAENQRKEEISKQRQIEKEQKQKEKEIQMASKQEALEKEIQEATPLKRKQYEIVQESNPMLDDYHTGIRSPKDIKTFEETINDEDNFAWGDFSQEDAKKALEKGEVTVYSSYPIDQGVFVSTSKQMATEYAGGDSSKVYSKTIPLNEVAWINGDEGQYAKVEETLQSSAEALQTAEKTTPTQEELDNLEYTRKNKSGSEYASEYYALGNKYGTTNLYKALNNYKSTGKALDTDIAPIRQELAESTKELVKTIKDTGKAVKTLKQELNEAKKDIKALVEENRALTEADLPMVEQEASENLRTATDDMAPIREDTTPDYEYENDNEGTESKPIDPLADRTLEDVGSRKVKAYQYEHPEVKPYFQEMAQYMLYDLNNSQKGERYVIGDMSQTGDGNYEFTGQKRHTTSDIASLLDSQYNYSYADIEKGLKAIIEDNGAENIAVAKRIEFALNDRLLNGYKDLYGYDIPPNQDYINLLKEKQWNDYYSSIPTSDIAPFENDLESQIENALSNKNSKSKRYLGKVTDYVANKIKDVLGINVNNRRHVLSDNDIRHMFKQHGNQDVETLKGQIAITKEDIKNIPDIINNPTDIVKGTDNKAGQTIRYIKRYNDNTTNVVEVVPDNSNALIIKTMWKKPSTLTNSIAPSSTSETQGSDISSTFVNNIYQNEENVNNIAPIRNQYEAIAPIRDDFDNGGPMLRVSPDMESKTLNKTSENKNVDFDLLEDTSKGNQQQFNTETNNIEDSIEKKTKKEIKAKLLKETGILNTSLDEANNIPKLLMENTDPIRLQEMIFGRDLGNQINKMFFQKVKDNTSEKIRFQNKERAEIKELGIKARSKESSAVQKYGEKQWTNETTGETLPYGDKELASEFPDVETQKKIKHASEVIRNKYDTYLDTTNKVLTELGYDAIPKRKDYMRHFQELNDIFSRVGIPYNYNEMTANDLPTDINGLTADFSPSKNFFASTLQRKGNKTTYDAITGIDGYLEGIGNLIYHTEDIQRLRAYEQHIRDTYGENHGFDNLETLTDEEKVTRIEKIQDNHLSNYASWLHEYTNTLAGKKALIDRSLEGLTGRKIYSFLNTTKTQVGRNMIGFNLSSAMTNAIAGVQSIAKTNKIASVKGLADTVKNIFVKDNFVEKNNFLTSRFGSDRLSKNLWQRMGDAGFVFMQGTDNFISQFVVRSKYNELKAKGLSDSEAHIEAGKYASRLMSDRSQGATANIYNSQTLGLVTQFQNEVNNQLYSMFYDTYHESKESAKGNALKTAAGMTFTLGQMAVFTHLFGKAFESMAGYNPTFDIIGIFMKALGMDDEEDEKETTAKNISQAFNQLVDALPYVNIITGGGRIPISEAFTGASDTFKALTGGKDQYGQDVSWEDALKSIKESAPYFLLPSGYSQIKKTTKGLGMYDEDLPIAGSYTDSGNLRFTAEEDTWSKIQAGLFGQWANDEAQAYVDSDFKSINKSNIEELIDLGMTSSEYRKLKSDISKSGKKTKDKVDYIATLDELNDNQKNILVNNILDRDYDVDVSNYEDYGSYEEFDYSYKNPEKYNWLKSEGISYNEYSASDESKELYNYAYKYPETYKLGKSITGDFATYKEYADYIWDLKADKDENGDSISGTKKTKVIEYVNGLDLSIPQKAMLIRKTYSSFDDYNYDIVDYVDSLDMPYEDKTIILKSLDMEVSDDGTISW